MSPRRRDCLGQPDRVQHRALAGPPLTSGTSRSAPQPPVQPPKHHARHHRDKRDKKRFGQFFVRQRVVQPTDNSERKQKPRAHECPNAQQDDPKRPQNALEPGGGRFHNTPCFVHGISLVPARGSRVCRRGLQVTPRLRLPFVRQDAQPCCSRSQACVECKRWNTCGP